MAGIRIDTITNYAISNSPQYSSIHTFIDHVNIQISLYFLEYRSSQIGTFTSALTSKTASYQNNNDYLNVYLLQWACFVIRTQTEFSSGKMISSHLTSSFTWKNGIADKTNNVIVEIVSTGCCSYVTQFERLMRILLLAEGTHRYIKYTNYVNATNGAVLYQMMK